jgi:hypothetical protein
MMIIKKYGHFLPWDRGVGRSALFGESHMGEAAYLMVCLGQRDQYIGRILLSTMNSLQYCACKCGVIDVKWRQNKSQSCFPAI